MSRISRDYLIQQARHVEGSIAYLEGVARTLEMARNAARGAHVHLHPDAIEALADSLGHIDDAIAAVRHGITTLEPETAILEGAA